MQCKPLEKIVGTYNENRPYASCDYLTPIEAHRKTGILPKRCKQTPFKLKAEAFEQTNSY